MSLNNTSNIFCMPYNGLHHFPMSSLFCFYPKQSTTMFLPFSQQRPQNWLNPKHWRWQILK
jgi:hypothetical protein